MSRCRDKGSRYVYVDVYDGKQLCRRAFRKSDVAQDGCTVICRAEDCYNIGHHRCAACERESYCSEACRMKDQVRHESICAQHASPSRQLMVKNFDRQAPCCGLPKCANPVVSLCRNCEATVCSKWECSKAHLDSCESYLDATIEREWVVIEWAQSVGKHGLIRDKMNACNKEEVEGEEWMLVSHSLP
jgi:hypothetical protein